MTKFSTSQAYYAAIAEPTYKKPYVNASLITKPEVGSRCAVVPKDHPAEYVNGIIVNTSEVVSISSGSFETLNSVYVCGMFN